MDHFDSPIDIDVAYNCELNLFTDLEPNSFKESASHDGWIECCKRSMMP